MGAREDNLESVVRGPSPSFNIQAFFEQMHNASATYVELWKRVIEAPADFAQRFPLYLALERTLSKAIDFEVTKELNQAVFTAIRDPNPIHHDQHNLVVGYGTTLGFAYSLLRANLPKEHLISMEANYTAKMMEGQTIRAKFIEYKERSDGTFVLAGQATGPKGKVAEYQYHLRFDQGQQEVPVLVQGKLAKVPKVHLPWYSEKQLKNRINKPYERQLNVNPATLASIQLVWDMLSTNQIDAADMLSKRDVSELVYAGLLSTAMARGGGDGTLFGNNKTTFVEPVCLGERLRGEFTITDVSSNDKKTVYKLPFTFNISTEDGRPKAYGSAFGMRPIMQ